MNTKIFFTDMDGTLLNTEKQISPSTFETLKKWTSAGHKLVLCSGRALDSLLHVRQNLGLNFPNMYLIGCNGGEIYDCTSHTLLLRLGLSKDTTQKVFELAKQYHIHVQTYTDTHILTAKDGEELAYYHRFIHTPALITDDIMTHLEKDPCKCLAIELTNLENLEQFRLALIEQLGESIKTAYSNPYYVEIIPISSGKDFGVKWLCEYLNIPIENALAAGDEINDISMIETAGIGIAMLNARTIVKEKADIITDTDHNHDGLVPILENAMK